MTAPADRDAGKSAPTERDKAAEAARLDLTQLHQDVVEAENRVVETHAAQLQEANEQLVVSSLRAQTDVATKVKELDEITRATGLDPLTGLPMRGLLLDRFGQALINAKRNDALLAVLFVDLDNFKQINDTLGHAFGDQALQLAAERFTSAVRAGDTVSRHGGDEFLILLAEIVEASDAVVVAEKVIAALSAAAQIGNQVLQLNASIGISVYPKDGDDAYALIERADEAMYLAKKHGGRCVTSDHPALETTTLPDSTK